MKLHEFKECPHFPITGDNIICHLLAPIPKMDSISLPRWAEALGEQHEKCLLGGKTDGNLY
jgi:hypothetical protein